MSINIAYRSRGEWIVMSIGLEGERQQAIEYALIIDKEITFKNKSYSKVAIVANRVRHTAKLLELSHIA